MIDAVAESTENCPRWHQRRFHLCVSRELEVAMLGRQLDDLTAADLHGLVDNAVREGRDVDYKQKVPSGTDEDKKEFLADVVSFANAAGGDIVYGIEEKRDANGRCTGEPARAAGMEGINADSEILRLESIVRDGVAPRIAGVRLRVVDGLPDGPAIVLRIPRSWSGPHMVTFKNSSRFFSRTSAGKCQLDVHEVRSAFLASEALGTRVTRFREERLGRIFAREVPGPLAHEGAIILHTVPAGAANPACALEISLAEREKRLLRPMGASSWNDRFNVDGFLTFTGSMHENNPIRAYVQVFRNGTIEFLATIGVTDDKGAHRVLPGQFERYCVEALESALAFYRAVGLAPPIFGLASLSGVKGCRLALAMEHIVALDRLAIDCTPSTIDRDVLVLPDVAIQALEESPALALRPAFDVLWQAGGLPRSLNYDKDGKWSIRRV